MVVIREDFQFETFKESLWCDIYLDNFKLLAGVCYRPPNSKDDTGISMKELGEAAKCQH